MQGSAKPLYASAILASASKQNTCPGGGMVYTKDLKSFESNLMRVRLPPWAQIQKTLERSFCLQKSLFFYGKSVAFI